MNYRSEIWLTLQIARDMKKMTPTPNWKGGHNSEQDLVRSLVVVPGQHSHVPYTFVNAAW